MVKTPRPCRRRVEGRVAHEGRLAGLGPEQVERGEHRRRVGLVAFRHVGGDDGVEVGLERQDGEGELDRLAPLRGHDAEPPALALEPGEDVLDPLEGLQLVVERLVVLAVDAHELVHPPLVDGPHLVVDVRAADSRGQLRLGVSTHQHVFVWCLNGREDAWRRRDRVPFEVERHVRITHSADRSALPERCV